MIISEKEPMAMPDLVVSVIIPTYNRADYLEESIESVLAQDFQPFEVVVVDDGSTDNTQEMLSGYESRVISIFQPNAGVSAARMTGIHAARSPFIAFHDSDDVMLPGRLAAQVEFMEAHPEVAAVTGNTVVQGMEQTNYLEHAGIDFGGQSWVVLDHPFQKLLCRNFMANPASMIRRECFFEIGGYDVSLPSGEDWDIWLRMSRQWPLACMNVPCTWLRKHEGNLSSTPAATACNIRIMDRALRLGETLDQDVLDKILNRLFGQIKRYITQNLTGSAEPHWQANARRCAEHLSWRRRLLVGFVLGCPRVLSGPLLALMIKTRAALREQEPKK